MPHINIGIALILTHTKHMTFDARMLVLELALVAQNILFFNAHLILTPILMYEIPHRERVSIK